MNVNFECLEKIPEIYNLLLLLQNEVKNKVEKRWLTTEELSVYIGYSAPADLFGQSAGVIRTVLK